MTTSTNGATSFSGQAREVVLCAYARSPFGRFNGVLAPLDVTELGAQVIDALLHRAGLAPEKVGALYNGIGLAGAAMLTATRQTVLRSALPETLPSVGIDRACCSGMTAIAQAARDIAMGLQDVAIAGGMESLSNIPLLMPRRHGVRPGSVQLTDPLILGGAVVDRPIATYSGEEALRFGVDRLQQDTWAVQSHERYFRAREQGWLAHELVPVSVTDGRTSTVVDTDEGPRRDSSLEKLSRLKTVYSSPTITAGNAPGLSDGAAYVVLATKEAANALGLQAFARVVACSQVAGGPTSGTSTPAVALQRALAAAGLGVDRLDRIEINEAYAATPLVSTRVLAGTDAAALEVLRRKTNPWGGAVAYGHPLGASGARLVMSLLSGLRLGEGGSGFAAAAICGGFGQGDALVLEKFDG